jgi:hypothetical protein
MDLPLLKNDITTSEPAFGIANILQVFKVSDNKKGRAISNPVFKISHLLF